MLMLLRGYRQIDFKSDDGPVRGIHLFVTFQEDGVTGEMVDKLFLREGFPVPKGLTVGGQIDVAFNRRGKPERITIPQSNVK